MKKLVTVALVGALLNTAACTSDFGFADSVDEVNPGATLFGIALVVAVMVAANYTVSEAEYQPQEASLPVAERRTFTIRCDGNGCPRSFTVVDVDYLGGTANANLIAFGDDYVTVEAATAGDIHLAVNVIEDGRRASFGMFLEVTR